MYVAREQSYGCGPKPTTSTFTLGDPVAAGLQGSFEVRISNSPRCNRGWWLGPVDKVQGWKLAWSIKVGGRWPDPVDKSEGLGGPVDRSDGLWARLAALGQASPKKL